MSITEYDQLIVVGTSGAPLATPVEPGDLLIRVAPQPGGFYSAVVLSTEAESRDALETRGVPVETGGLGTYVEVREVATGDGPARNVGRRLTDSRGHLPRGQSLLRAVDTRPQDERETEDVASTPVKARILWPALGFPAVIAPKDPPSSDQMREADATRCITVLVMSNRPYLSKAEAAAGLRYVPWRDRHRRYMQDPTTVGLPSLRMRPQELPQPGFFDEVELELTNDKQVPKPPKNAAEPPKLVVPDGKTGKPVEDDHAVLVRFGANQEGEHGITVSLAKYVRDFYRGLTPRMDYLCEIRVSERASGRLADGLYHLFWNNQQPGEDKPSDEMQLLLGSFAEPHQQRFTKYWQKQRAWLLQHYEYEYGSLEPSYAFPPTPGPKVRAEVLHPLFVKRDFPRRLAIGHVTDLHVDVRADVYEHNLRPAQVGANYNNWNTSVRSVYGAAKETSDILLLTGDLIDYGRGFWGLSEQQHLGQDSYYVIDRNWSLFYHLIASGDDNYKKPVYTSLGNHDWRINPYPPFAPGGPGMLSLFHNRGQLTRKQRQHVQNAEKEFIKVAHRDGHERGFSYQSVAREWYQLIAEQPWDSFKTALKMTFLQIKSLDKKGTPVETTIDSVAWYLLSINPFLDYSFTLPGGHEVLMLDWAEDENVLFPIVAYGKAYRYLPWQAKEAADPGPKAGRCLTPLQKWHVETFATEGAGKAKVIGIHAPPIGPYTDWSDVDLSREKKIYEKKGKSRGPAKGYATLHKDGTTEQWSGHPIYAITPPDAPEGMQADYGSFEQHRDWFIKRMLDPDTRGVRLIFSGHIHRNNLLVVHRGVSGRKDSAIAGELLVRGVFPGQVSSARFPAVTARGDIGPLYVNTTSAGPRGHWYPNTVPDPKTVIQVNARGEPVGTPAKQAGRGVDEEDIGHVLYGSVEPGFAQVELSNDGTIHRVEFRTVTGIAGSVPVAGALAPRRAVG